MRVKHSCNEIFSAEVYGSPWGDIFEPATCPACGRQLNNTNTDRTEGALTVDEFTIDIGTREPDEFSHTEAAEIVKKYVCAVCTGQLIVQPIPNDFYAMVICPEHGSVTRAGRIMRSTVSIELEQARRDYDAAIKNLADLWPGLQEAPKDEAQIMRELGY
jgi:hypothetical protein